MPYQNSIANEISALQYLNRFLVVSVYDNVAKIDAQIRSGILKMRESGIPTEVCMEFRGKHYEEKNRHLFKEICDTISEEHIPAIKQYLEDLANQYYQATGTSIEVGQFLTFPDPSQSANVAAPLTERNSSVSDYALQCDAICDFTDFLAQQTENLDLVLLGYTNCCNDLLNCGVPIQVRDHYVETYALPLGKVINYNLREALTEAYRYLVEMYDQIVASMNKIGLSVNRAPRALAVSSCGGGGSSSFAAAQAREQNLKEMEKYFGKPNPEIKHNIAKADKQNANPHWGEKDGYAINCATCALAYVLRYCFGFDVTAKGNNKRSESLNYWLSINDNSFKVWKNADGSPMQPSYMVDWMKQNHKEKMEPQDYKRYFDEVCKEKGVYILTLTWKGGGGHATILQRDENGRLYYIEPQVYDRELSDEHGRRNIDELVDELTPNPSSITGVLRVDDKVFDVGEQSFYINEGTYRDSKGNEHPNPMTRVMDDGNHGIGEREVVKMSYSDLVEKITLV